MDVLCCLIKSVCDCVRACRQMQCDAGRLTAAEGFYPALLLLWGNEGKRTEYCRFTVVVSGCPSGAAVRWTQDRLHLASRRVTSATSPTQLCSGLAGSSWQAVLTFTAELAECEVLTAVLWVCTLHRLASVVLSDVQNESSAVEMYQAIRCHIPEDLSVRVAEFVVQPIAWGLVEWAWRCADWLWAALRCVVLGSC